MIKDLSLSLNTSNSFPSRGVVRASIGSGFASAVNSEIVHVPIRAKASMGKIKVLTLAGVLILSNRSIIKFNINPDMTVPSMIPPNRIMKLGSIR